MTFGLLGDTIIGLAVTALILGWLDHRKSRWTGRRLDGSTPRTDAGAPGYRGGMKRPPAPLEPPLTVGEAQDLWKAQQRQRGVPLSERQRNPT